MLLAISLAYNKSPLTQYIGSESVMIALNDIFLGKVILNPVHINFMRKSYSRKRQVRDAQTIVIYCLPDQHATK